MYVLTEAAPAKEPGDGGLRLVASWVTATGGGCSASSSPGQNFWIRGVCSFSWGCWSPGEGQPPGSRDTLQVWLWAGAPRFPPAALRHCAVQSAPSPGPAGPLPRYTRCLLRTFLGLGCKAGSLSSANEVTRYVTATRTAFFFRGREKGSRRGERRNRGGRGAFPRGTSRTRAYA